MNVLDLFSGIGGFSLGLERAGMRTVAFCEIDPFCRRVLAKHWPGIACHDDITTREFEPSEADVICGGFPCQDISLAGSGAGIAGERSGLWRELLRAVCVVRPRYAIVENVAMLLGRGMGEILGDLAEIGYDAEWHCIPASAVGAPHRRDRIWIIAYPQHERRWGVDSAAWNGEEPSGGGGAITDAGLERLPERARLLTRRQIADAAASAHQWRLTEPAVCRADDGIPNRVDRVKALGNAVVPQITELIGRAIMNAHIANW